jgi:hypothetical protein
MKEKHPIYSSLNLFSHVVSKTSKTTKILAEFFFDFFSSFESHFLKSLQCIDRYSIEIPCMMECLSLGIFTLMYIQFSVREKMKRNVDDEKEELCKKISRILYFFLTRFPIYFYKRNNFSTNQQI